MIPKEEVMMSLLSLHDQFTIAVFSRRSTATRAVLATISSKQTVGITQMSALMAI